MSFDDLICRSTVFVNVAASNKKAAFQALANRTCFQWGIGPEMIVEALHARESLGTTGFGGGIAVPHGRVQTLPRMVGAIMRLAQPIAYEALDGAPVGLMFMLLGPDSAGADHLKALARVSRALRDRALVAKLLGARDADALHALLCPEPAETRSAA
ncbi:PTS sugar transporter subunit IIA [Sandaracinobacteroides saxicola]|uniref:PTS sugar transporter subunit IIA n=1 Tax=Sandaracinobacteroides saxicola TaxID=2759707 RepID=A0A7G5IM61_9SPHN|nr:PTS sugar transporter subunit IIA [Sandaracinobacteroides saxicola]QMW24453.1 PTS sugar transporter subunit IIA [Sandaracinobacteroides saxicola]